jgi:cytochrome c biogenesis protein CcmG/thiol:disulfide interchange protein DsbE
MNRFLIPLGAFALLVIVLGVGIKRSPEKGIIISPLLGKPAPEFALPNLTAVGETVKSADLQGRWYVFNVWGTWCGGCRAEHNTLLQIQRSGVVPIVGMDWRDNESEALSMLREMGNPYEVIAVDKDGREAVDWGVYGAPETFLVNDKGVIVYKYVGPLTPQAWEKEFLPRLPQREAGAAAPPSKS